MVTTTLMAVSRKCEAENPKVSMHAHGMWLFLKIMTAVTQICMECGWILAKSNKQLLGGLIL